MRKRSISIPLRVTEAERTAIDKKAEKVANFLLSVGVTQAEIDSIRNIFLG